MPRYARVKGESEQAVKRQGPAVVSIFRPSVIIGSPHTPKLLGVALSLLSPLMPQRYRPISTTQIAHAMLSVSLSAPRQSAIYSFEDMRAQVRTRS